MFYFNDAPTLLDQIIHLDVPLSVGGWIVALTFSTYLMAGYAREQVCTYMCPYARFQSAMFDKNTLIIAYDEKRGEPRGKWKELQALMARLADHASHEPANAALHGEGSSLSREQLKTRGHCIDCDSCVVVCPMGIDIRNGLQMECIACGLCVDACNNVMDKIGLPRGLIRYETESKKRFTLFRARSFWYAGILSAVGGLMLYGLMTRAELDLNVIHDRNPLLVKLSDGAVRNGYTVHIINKTHEDHRYRLSVHGLDYRELHVEGAGNLSADSLPVFADSVGQFRIYITAEKQPDPRQGITFEVRDNMSGEISSSESIFVSERP